MKFFAIVLFAGALALARAADEESGEQVETVDDSVPSDQMLLDKHPGADTHVLFTKPGGVRLVSGQDAQVLVGFINRASEDLFLDTLDASFRLAGDYNSVIQNLSAIAYNRKLSENQEASLFYQFHVDNVLSGMPVALEVSLVYHDMAGRFYRQAVFNSTLTVEEPDVSFDAETFFLYVFLAACAVVAAVLCFQCMGQSSAKKAAVAARTETGTKDGDVDYAWLPQAVLKQGGGSKPSSPRQRKQTKNA